MILARENARLRRAPRYFCGLKGMMPGIQDMLKGVCEKKGLDYDEFIGGHKSRPASLASTDETHGVSQSWGVLCGATQNKRALSVCARAQASRSPANGTSRSTDLPRIKK